MTKCAKGFDFNFSTCSLQLHEKEALVDSGKIALVPIGTECYEVEGTFGWYKKISVTEKNQRIITMFWNDMYFLKEEEAKNTVQRLKGEYGAYQQHIADYGVAIRNVKESLIAEGCPPEYFDFEMEERLAAMGY